MIFPVASMKNEVIMLCVVVVVTFCATNFFIVAQFRRLLSENKFPNFTAGGETKVQIWDPIRPSVLTL